MFKKDVFEEFLFLFSKVDNMPFESAEDALVNNFSALDTPFTDYSKSVIGYFNHLKLEISENLLSIQADEKQFYLNYVLDKLKLETNNFDKSKLIDLLKYYRVNPEILDFNKNKQLKNLLNTSFRAFSGDDNLLKFSDFHREYYKHLLDIERNCIIKYLSELIKQLDNSKDLPDDAHKDSVWFKLGVLFASGKMEKYYNVNDKGVTVLNNGFSAPKAAKELGNKSYIKYISATINNYDVNNSNGDKNIFNSRVKMMKIIAHCNENDIPVIPYFIERLPSE